MLRFLARLLNRFYPPRLDDVGAGVGPIKPTFPPDHPISRIWPRHDQETTEALAAKNKEMYIQADVNFFYSYALVVRGEAIAGNLNKAAEWIEDFRDVMPFVRWWGKVRTVDF